MAILFGLMLIYTAYRAWFEDPAQKTESGLINWLSRYLPVTSDTADGHWHLRREGKTYVTPLAVALIAVELTDIMFAIDSVPAVFAVSRDPVRGVAPPPSSQASERRGKGRGASRRAQ